MSTLTHHGIIYVPFGYVKAFGQMSNLTEIHGGSPWGAGTFSVSAVDDSIDSQMLVLMFGYFQAADGSRQPTEKELQIA